MAKANPESMKWPTNKAIYDMNYLRLYGKVCPRCGGVGGKVGMYPCDYCRGIGWVEKSK